MDITPAKPGTKTLTPEEVYKAAVNSVFVVGSLYPHKNGNWEVGTYATAWVLAADGVLVTNWHVFEDLNDGEVFKRVAIATARFIRSRIFSAATKPRTSQVFRIAGERT